MVVFVSCVSTLYNQAVTRSAKPHMLHRTAMHRTASSSMVLACMKTHGAYWKCIMAVVSSFSFVEKCDV